MMIRVCVCFLVRALGLAAFSFARKWNAGRVDGTVCTGSVLCLEDQVKHGRY